VSRVPLRVAFLETQEPSLYHQIAEKAAHLRELGLSFAAIARRLGVDDKTVAKAVRLSRRQLGVGSCGRPSHEERPPAETSYISSTFLYATNKKLRIMWL